MTFHEVLNYTWSIRWELLLGAFILIYRQHIYTHYIFNPLAGGNGKIQMDECAKAVLLVMIIKASDLEGRSPVQVYPDIYWIMLFASVCAIAALKVPFSKLLNKNEETTTTTKTNISTETL